MIRKLLILAAAASTVVLTARAEEAVPDMVGHWETEAEALVLVKPGEEPPRVTDARLTVRIDTQDGRRFSGRELSHESANPSRHVQPEERIAGVIGADGTTVVIVDENGVRDCRILSGGSMECIYQHIDANRSVVARSLWTKQAQ